jgi:hypothetical protein
MRVFEQPDGMKLRPITDRPIRFRRGLARQPFQDYNLSAVEVTVHKDKKEKWKGEGTRSRVRLKMDKSVTRDRT